MARLLLAYPAKDEAHDYLIYASCTTTAEGPDTIPTRFEEDKQLQAFPFLSHDGAAYTITISKGADMACRSSFTGVKGRGSHPLPSAIAVAPNFAPAKAPTAAKETEEDDGVSIVDGAAFVAMFGGSDDDMDDEEFVPRKEFADAIERTQPAAAALCPMPYALCPLPSGHISSDRLTTLC